MTRPFVRSDATKYRSVRTNGFASKREAEYAAELAIRKSATNGDIADWLEQVPIRLPSGRYVVDFMVIYRSGKVEFVEVKGFETPQWKAKMRELAATRPEIFARLSIVR